MRSRMFVAYPAKVGQDDETGGQSEVGARYFEGAAAGALLIGRAPTTPLFNEYFGPEEALIDLGSSAAEATDVVAGLLRQPERLRAIGRRNATKALRRFDWSYRWQTILRQVGEDPLPPLLERLNRLSELADDAESSACPRGGLGQNRSSSV
ncbi:MAG: glycosyltransferase [Bryobacteraceae bacterium]